MENKIKCEVKNCVYHTTQNHCTADCITVGNPTACKCGETACETFRMNDNKTMNG
ncbi:MAG: DUF1540 domain-containing protein [Clostridia bacterium]|nr:DUF1540 domain-containing protein [Clostridia bacterium]